MQVYPNKFKYWKAPAVFSGAFSFSYNIFLGLT